MTKKITVLISLLLLHFFSVAQPGDVEMADSFRSNGKIYVVVAVILTIFAGLITYLVRLDKKITKLERNAFVDQSLDLKQ